MGEIIEVYVLKLFYINWRNTQLKWKKIHVINSNIMG